MKFIGVAWCFNLWVIPIIKLNSSPSAIAQLEETSRRGGIWLEPLNAGIVALLAATALVLSQHDDPTEAATWKNYAAASGILVQVAWWERVTIFPLDNSITVMKDNKEHFKSSERNWLNGKSQLELMRLMDSWTKRHAVRATLPFLAAMTALSPKLWQSL